MHQCESCGGSTIQTIVAKPAGGQDGELKNEITRKCSCGHQWTETVVPAVSQADVKTGLRLA